MAAKLDPYVDFIYDYRAKGMNYPQISAALEKEHGITIDKKHLQVFWSRHLKKVKKRVEELSPFGALNDLKAVAAANNKSSHKPQAIEDVVPNMLLQFQPTESHEIQWERPKERIT